MLRNNRKTKGMTLKQTLERKLEQMRKTKEAVCTIEKIQQERDTQQQIKTIMEEYGVDEDTARLYVREQRHKEHVKAAVAKRNQTIKGIGAAIGKGFAKAAEAQREAAKRKNEKSKQKKKEEDEVIWVPQT